MIFELFLRIYHMGWQKCFVFSCSFFVVVFFFFVFRRARSLVLLMGLSGEEREWGV